MIFNPVVVGKSERADSKDIHVDVMCSFYLYYTAIDGSATELYSHPLTNPVYDVKALSGTVIACILLGLNVKASFTNCTVQYSEDVNESMRYICFVN